MRAPLPLDSPLLFKALLHTREYQRDYKQYREEWQERLEKFVRLNAEQDLHYRINYHRDYAQHRKADYHAPQPVFVRDFCFEVYKLNATVIYQPLG